MISHTNYWKLGLFVAVSFVAFVGVVWWLGLQRFHREVFGLVTYFDESVYGLEVGAPVKMRGVSVGSVSDINFAPDKQMVEVRMDIYRAVMERVGLDAPDGRPEEGEPYIDSRVRAQIAMAGITGLKFLLLDIMPGSPPPKLSFEPPYNYVPAAPSTLKSLEDGVRNLVERLPAIIDNAEGFAVDLREKMRDVDLASLSDNANQLLVTLEGKLAEIEPGAFLDEAQVAVTELREFVNVAEGLLDSLDSEEGPLNRAVVAWEELTLGVRTALDEAQVGETTASLRDSGASLQVLARDSGGLSMEAQRSLSSLREALNSLRRLADLLERNPSVILRGRPGD